MNKDQLISEHEVTVSHLSIEQFIPEKLEREWGSETIIAKGPTFLTKLLHMKAGRKGGLQFHVEKTEAFYLQYGEAEVEYVDEEGELITVPMVPGMCFFIPPGAIHRVTALEECLFIEGSSPHFDDRVHVEEPGQETGGLPSTWESEDGIHFRRKT